MSWSGDRTKEIQRSPEDIIEKIGILNAVLRQLAVDSNLTDDLTDPTVQIAIKHWTNEKRLHPEEAKKLEDHYKVLSVLQKLHSLQHSCKALGIPVPIDHFLLRRNMLSDEIIIKMFGEEILLKMKATQKETKTKSSSSSTLTSSSNKTNESAATTTTTATTKPTTTTKPLVEYGPQLPSSDQLSKRQNEGDKEYSWGKEPYGTPGFTWFKLLTRTTIELLLIAGVAILVAIYLSPKHFQKIK